jgi:hypothetical protein
VVRVPSKAFAALYGIVIQYPEGTEIHPIGIKVMRKTEGMPCIEPSVIGMATGVGGVQYGFHLDNFMSFAGQRDTGKVKANRLTPCAETKPATKPESSF